MRDTFIALLGMLLLATAISCEPVESPDECPDGTCPGVLVESLADVPPQLRQPNFSPYGQGSCVHATTITLLNWQGQDELAKWWKENYHSGEYAERLINRMESAGLQYAYTDTGDEAFLEWATRNRMASGIFYFYRHAVTLVDLNDTEAVLLDNNRTGEYIRIPRAEFLWNWKNEYGGFAWTVVYGSPPPYPEW